MLSAVCIFLTLYLYYRFTEIQHDNLDTRKKVAELQARLDEFLAKQNESDAKPPEPVSSEESSSSED